MIYLKKIKLKELKNKVISSRMQEEFGTKSQQQIPPRGLILKRTISGKILT
jgi:hypothetical protein